MPLAFTQEDFLVKKMFCTQGIYLPTPEIFEVLKIKGYTTVVSGKVILYDLFFAFCNSVLFTRDVLIVN